MGTYAVTHVKCNNQIIALSDSNQVSFSGQGLNNMLGIFYFDTPTLIQLFNNYDASLKMDVSKAPSYNHNYAGKEDAKKSSHPSGLDIDKIIKDEKGIEWFNNLENSFILPLIQNANPHRGRDYNYFDYMVDLDKEVFINAQMKIDFSRIREMTPEKLTAFAKKDYSVLPATLRENIKFYHMDTQEIDEVFYAFKKSDKPKMK